MRGIEVRNPSENHREGLGWKDNDVARIRFEGALEERAEKDQQAHWVACNAAIQPLCACIAAVLAPALIVWPLAFRWILAT